MLQLGASKKHKESSRFLKIFLAIFVVTMAAVGLIRYLNLTDEIFSGPRSVVQLITDSGLKNDNGRVNILLLGTGGEGHEGPDLTDTIILASIDKKGKDVALVSIPRDTWAPGLEAKINTAYAFGLEKGDGLDLAKKTVRELFDLPIHYAFRIDFDGFIRAVDLVGGIDVEVENDFVDNKYPVMGKENDTCGLEIERKIESGFVQTYYKDATGSAVLVTDQNNPFTCRYETISYKKGITHMDGITTLKFVRSRYGTNDEGSDFKRSARQQKVILAFRQKVLSAQTLTDPKILVDLVKNFGSSIDTDINNDDIPHFVKLGQKIEPNALRRVVLDSDREGSVLEVGNPEDHGGQFVLVPKNNMWTDLAEYIQAEIFKFQENPPKTNKQKKN